MITNNKLKGALNYLYTKISSAYYTYVLSPSISPLKCLSLISKYHQAWLGPDDVFCRQESKYCRSEGIKELYDKESTPTSLGSVAIL